MLRDLQARAQEAPITITTQMVNHQKILRIYSSLELQAQARLIVQSQTPSRKCSMGPMDCNGKELACATTEEHNFFSNQTKTNELSLLKTQFGNVNPITEYFRTRRNEVLRTMKEAKRCTSQKPQLPFCLDPDSLSLIPDPRPLNRLPTYLLKIANEKCGKIWTVLKPPFMEAQKQIKIPHEPEQCEHDNTGKRKAPKTQLVGTGEHLWALIPDKNKHTIEYVKKHTLGWTVGLYDFTGHGQRIGQGGRGLDLTDKQKILAKCNWECQSTYPLGMRKLDLVSWRREKVVNKPMQDDQGCNCISALKSFRTIDGSQVPKSHLSQTCRREEEAEKFSRCRSGVCLFVFYDVQEEGTNWVKTN
ncbi:hypothetical protein B0H10DRAFT_1962501 [Mycena sp. CBHHK59/15]|nr:hypothetical protein B0H10DRAFT_1962501 [Mycena sp. CBHHK59/15]